MTEEHSPQAPLSERKRVDTNIYEARGRYYLRIQGWNEHATHRQYIRTWVACNESYDIETARRLLQRIQRDLKAGRFIAERYARLNMAPTLKDTFEDALQQRILGGIKPSTITHWHYNAKRWLPTLGAIPVADLDYQDVREWWETWSKEAPSENAANQALKLLRAVLAHATRTGWRPPGANPASAVATMRKPVKIRARPITAKDWQRISEWLAEHDRRRCQKPGGQATHGKTDYMGHWAYAVTQVSLAARGGEICGLEWSDIRWDENVIILRDTKTAPSLARPVAPELLDLLQKHGQLMNIYGAPRMRYNTLIFPSLFGKRTTPNSRFNKVFRQALQELDLPWGRKNGGWTPHDLRRWGINLLYETGATTRDVMEYVGHSTAEAHQLYLRASPHRLRHLANGISSTAIPASLFEYDDDSDTS